MRALLIVLAVLLLALDLVASFHEDHHDLGSGERVAEVLVPHVASPSPAEHRLDPLGSRFLELISYRPKARSRPLRAKVKAVAVYPTDALLHALAMCETGGRMDNPNTGNGYFGFFQFSLATWRSVGGARYPHEHSYAEQASRARALILRSGWGQFPRCSRTIGAR